MIQTVEAEIDKEGNVRLKESVKLDEKQQGVSHYPGSIKRHIRSSFTE
jgi:hypothetical protein